jgi:hypothetical protein
VYGEAIDAIGLIHSSEDPFDAKRILASCHTRYFDVGVGNMRIGLCESPQAFRSVAIFELPKCGTRQIHT